MPALPLDEAGKYVAGAYVVFVLLLVVYIGIMAAKLSRISRELDEIAEVAEKRAAGSKQQAAIDSQSAREPEAPVASGGDRS
jgi:hypothetical protein